jgi:hypothetical protein
MAQKDSVALVVKPVSKMIVKGERYMTHARVCVACVFWINAHTWGINSVGHISFPFHYHLTNRGQHRAYIFHLHRRLVAPTAGAISVPVLHSLGPDLMRIPGVSIAWVIYLSPFTIILLTGLTTRATESFRTPHLWIM